MTDQPACPCREGYHAPGSPARLVVSAAGLLGCRHCGRSIHPIILAEFLRGIAPLLVAIANRYRGRD